MADELEHTGRTWLPGFWLANLVGQAIPLTALNTLRARLPGGGLPHRRASTFDLDDTITLGRNVSLGPNVAIYTSRHLLGPSSRRMHPSVIKRPMVIEGGV